MAGAVGEEDVGQDASIVLALDLALRLKPSTTKAFL